tara:strand:- start:285 stop:3212 length:2928 start_codon:yes stop_codon:yes gene_type:complete
MVDPRIFLPTNLNPQGFLTDMLLSQARDPSFKDSGINRTLADYLYSGKINPKIFSIASSFGNKFETEILLKSKESRTRETKETKIVRDSDYIDFILSLTPAQMSLFTPQIRLYKKYKDVNSKAWKQSEFIFGENVHDINLINSKTDKNFGLDTAAGIEDVTVKRNYHRFLVANDYYIDINFVFSSFDMLANGLARTHQGEASYLDLIRNNLNPGPKPKNTESCFSPKSGKGCPNKKHFKYFEQIMLEYGWNVKKAALKELLSPKQEKFIDKFIKEEKKILPLQYLSHNISLEESGKLSLSVRYIGSPEFAKDTEHESTTVVQISNKNLINKICTKDPTKDPLKKQLEELNNLRKQIDAKITSCKKEKIQQEEEVKKELSKKYFRIKAEVSKSFQDLLLRKMSDDKNLFYLRYKSSDRSDLKKKVIRRRGRKTKRTYTSKIRERAKIPGVNLFLDRIKIETGDTYSIDTTDSFSHKISVEDTTSLIEKAEASKYKTKTGEEFLLSQIKKSKKTSVADLDKKVQEAVKKLSDTMFYFPNMNKHPLSNIGHFGFFPLRALISALYDFYDGACFVPPYVLLGNTVGRSFGKNYWANIGDLLVEVNVFQSWLYRHLILKNNFDISFGGFMKAIMTDLVPEVLYGHSSTGMDKSNFGSIIRDTYHIDEKYVTKAATAIQKNLQSADSDRVEMFLNKLAIKFNENPSPKSIKLPVLFYRLYPTPAQAVETPALMSSILSVKDLDKRKFKRREDHKDGLIHLFVSEDRGLVQEITLRHNDMQKLRSALVFNQDKDHGQPILKMIYSADVTLFGTNLFLLNGFFALPSRQFKISAEEDELGVIGYYQINTLVDRIKGGSYTTSISGMNLAPYAFQKGEIQASKKKTNCGTTEEICKEITKKQQKTKTTKEKKGIPSVYIRVSASEYVARLLERPEISKHYGITVVTEKKLDDKINKVGTSVASGTTPPAAAGSAGPQVAEAAAI